MLTGMHANQCFSSPAPPAQDDAQAGPGSPTSINHRDSPPQTGMEANLILVIPQLGLPSQCLWPVSRLAVKELTRTATLLVMSIAWATVQIQTLTLSQLDSAF